MPGEKRSSLTYQIDGVVYSSMAARPGAVWVLGAAALDGLSPQVPSEERLRRLER